MTNENGIMNEQNENGLEQKEEQSPLTARVEPKAEDSAKVLLPTVLQESPTFAHFVAEDEANEEQYAGQPTRQAALEVENARLIANIEDMVARPDVYSDEENEEALSVLNQRLSRSDRALDVFKANCAFNNEGVTSAEMLKAYWENVKYLSSLDQMDIFADRKAKMARAQQVLGEMFTPHDIAATDEYFATHTHEENAAYAEEWMRENGKEDTIDAIKDAIDSGAEPTEDELASFYGALTEEERAEFGGMWDKEAVERVIADKKYKKATKENLETISLGLFSPHDLEAGKAKWKKGSTEERYAAWLDRRDKWIAEGRTIDKMYQHQSYDRMFANAMKLVPFMSEAQKALMQIAASGADLSEFRGVLYLMDKDTRETMMSAMSAVRPWKEAGFWNGIASGLEQMYDKGNRFATSLVMGALAEATGNLKDFEESTRFNIQFDQMLGWDKLATPSGYWQKMWAGFGQSGALQGSAIGGSMAARLAAKAKNPYLATAALTAGAVFDSFGWLSMIGEQYENMLLHGVPMQKALTIGACAGSADWLIEKMNIEAYLGLNLPAGEMQRLGFIAAARAGLRILDKKAATEIGRKALVMEFGNVLRTNAKQGLQIAAAETLEELLQGLNAAGALKYAQGQDLISAYFNSDTWREGLKAGADALPACTMFGITGALFPGEAMFGFKQRNLTYQATAEMNEMLDAKAKEYALKKFGKDYTKQQEMEARRILLNGASRAINVIGNKSKVEADAWLNAQEDLTPAERAFFAEMNQYYQSSRGQYGQAFADAVKSGNLNEALYAASGIKFTHDEKTGRITSITTKDGKTIKVNDLLTEKATIDNLPAETVAAFINQWNAENPDLAFGTDITKLSAEERKRLEQALNEGINGFYDPSTNTITLTANATQGTLGHEMSHALWFENVEKGLENQKKKFRHIARTLHMQGQPSADESVAKVVGVGGDVKGMKNREKTFNLRDSFSFRTAAHNLGQALKKTVTLGKAQTTFVPMFAAKETGEVIDPTQMFQDILDDASLDYERKREEAKEAREKEIAERKAKAKKIMDARKEKRELKIAARKGEAEQKAAEIKARHEAFEKEEAEKHKAREKAEREEKRKQDKMLENRKHALNHPPRLGHSKFQTGEEAQRARAAYIFLWKALMGKTITKEEVDWLEKEYGISAEDLNLSEQKDGTFRHSDKQLLPDEVLTKHNPGLVKFFMDIHTVKIIVPDVVVATEEEAANAVPNEVYDPFTDSFIEGRIVVDPARAKSFREQSDEEVNRKKAEQAKQDAMATATKPASTTSVTAEEENEAETEQEPSVTVADLAAAKEMPEGESYTPPADEDALVQSAMSRTVEYAPVDKDGKPTKAPRKLPPGAYNLLRMPYSVNQPTKPKPSVQDKRGRGLGIYNTPKAKDSQGRYWGGIFPAFMGRKDEMANRTSQAIRNKMTKEERDSYKTVVDYFGGGGCWGLYHALTNFENANEVIINEWDVDRTLKIQLLHEIDGEVANIARKVLFEPRRLAALDAALQNVVNKKTGERGTSSPSTIATHAEALFKTELTDPVERAAFCAFLDCASTIYASAGEGATLNDFKLGIEDALRDIEEDGRKAKEAADAFKARGGKISYHAGDALTFDTKTGKDVVAVCDPPYYRTAGYGKKGEKVPLDSQGKGWDYKSTGALMQKLVDSGSAIVYTDEAWWYKQDYEFGYGADKKGPSKKGDPNIFRGENEILSNIINIFDYFDVAGRVASRQETLGVHHGQGKGQRVRNDAKPNGGTSSSNAQSQPLDNNAGGTERNQNAIHDVAAVADRQGGAARADGAGGGREGGAEQSAEQSASVSPQPKIIPPPRISVSPAPRFSISRLYTGSAADYDKPSLHAIGTGEGAQAYGWGLYASSRRGIAEAYASADKSRKTTKPNSYVTKNGKVLVEYDTANLDTSTEAYVAEVLLSARGDLKQAKDKLRKRYNDFKTWCKVNYVHDADEQLRHYKEALEEIKEHGTEYDYFSGKKPVPQEHVYEQTFFTNRPEDDGSRLLDWFGHLNETQKGILAEELGAEVAEDMEDLLGSEIYETFVDIYGSPKAASEHLAAIGIDGIKYPAQAFRNSKNRDGRKGWNYVSFRDDNIRVDHKWTDGQPRFSIRRLTDGREYVNIGEVPAEFRAAQTLKEKKRIVSKYIRTRWIGKVIDETGVRVFVNGNTAQEYAFPAKKLSEQIVSDKLDAATELEAIVATSQNPVIVPDGQDGHFHKDVKHWEHRTVMFAIGGRVYSSKVNIKVLKKKNKKGENQRLLHDVTDIKDITGEIRSLIGEEPKYPFYPSESATSIPYSGAGAQGENAADGMRRLTTPFKPGENSARFSLGGNTDEIAALVIAREILETGRAPSSANVWAVKESLRASGSVAQLLERGIAKAQEQRNMLNYIASDPKRDKILVNAGLADRHARIIERARQADLAFARGVEKKVAKQNEALARVVRDTNGLTSETILNHYGIDPNALLIALAPEENERKRGEKADEQEVDESASAGVVDVDAPHAVTPEMLATAEAIAKPVIERAKQLAEKAKADKREIKVDEDGAKKTPKKKTAANEEEELSPEEARDEVVGNMVTKAIAQAISESGITIDSAAGMVKLVEALTEQYIRDNADLYEGIDLENVWGDPRAIALLCGNIAAFAKMTASAYAPSFTLARVGRNAQRLSDQRITSREKAEQVGVQIFEDLNRDIVRQSRKQLIREIHRTIDNIAKKHTENQLNKDRKVESAVSEYLKFVKKAINMSAEQVEKRMDELEALLEKNYGTAETPDNGRYRDYYMWKQELAVLDYYGNLKSRMPSEIMEVRDFLEQMVNESMFAMMESSERWEAAANEAIESLEGAIKRSPKDGDKKPEKTPFVYSLVGMWEPKIRQMTRFEKDPAVREKALKAAQALEQMIQSACDTQYNTIEKYKGELLDALVDAYGSVDKAREALAQEFEGEDWFFIIDPNDEHPQDRVTLTVGRALQMYVSIVQNDYAENCEKWGRNAEYRAKLEALLGLNNPESPHMKLVTAMREIYMRIGGDLDTVLFKTTGTHLRTPNQNYMPVVMSRRRNRGKNGEGRAFSPFAPALTPRVKNGLDFNQEADILSVFFDRLEQSAHTIAWADIGPMVMRVAQSDRILNAIESAFGNKAAVDWNKYILDIVAGAKKKSAEEAKMGRLLMRYASRLWLGMNPASWAKQLSGVPSYALSYWGSNGDWVRSAAAWLTSPMQMAQAARDLAETAAFKARYGTAISQELKYATSGENQLMTWWDRFINGTMQGVMQFDKVGCYALTAVYARKREEFENQGKGKQEASELAAQWLMHIVDKTAQSGRTINQTEVQRSGEGWAFLLQFKSAPVQQTQFEIVAFQEWNADKGNGKKLKKFLAAVLINHFIVPAWSSAIEAAVACLANWGVPEEEKRKRLWRILFGNMISGSLGSICFLGAILEGAADFAAGLIVGDKSRFKDSFGEMVPAEGAISALASHIEKFAKALGEVGEKDINETMLDMCEAVGASVPGVSWMTRKGFEAYRAATEDPREKQNRINRYERRKRAEERKRSR